VVALSSGSHKIYVVIFAEFDQATAGQDYDTATSEIFDASVTLKQVRDKDISAGFNS